MEKALPDQFTKDTCLLGTGATCCRYLTLGPDGFQCAKLTGLRAYIDGRAEQMSAKGDNCEGIAHPV